MSGAILNSSVYGVQDATPGYDTGPNGTDLQLGSSAPSNFGAGTPVPGRTYSPDGVRIGYSTVVSSISPSSGGVPSGTILKFNDFFGGVLATGTAAQLLGQFTYLLDEDANETDGGIFTFSVIPSLGLPDGSGIYFSNTGELQDFLQRSASPPPPSPPPPSPQPPAPYVSPQDVTNLYEDECGRAPTPAEVANTQTAIANRWTSMQQLRVSASTSPEVTQSRLATML